MNRFERRNTGKIGSSVSVGSGNSSVLNASMSRGGFVKTMGVGMAALGAAATGLGGVARATGTSTTVMGINNPDRTHIHPADGMPCTEDVYNVQNAVDNYDTVFLSGEFHFGDVVSYDYGPEWGYWLYPGDFSSGVMITRPGVTLTSAPGSRAKIYSGGAVTDDYSWVYSVCVKAPGVTIRGLEFIDFPTMAIHIRGTDETSSNPVVIEDNIMHTNRWEGYVYASGQAPITSWNYGSWPMVITKNVISGYFGGLSLRGLGMTGTSSIDVTNNQITRDLRPISDDSEDAWIKQLTHDVVGIWGWTMNSLAPEFNPDGDNGPIMVADNTIEVHLFSYRDLGNENMAITVARSHMGTSHCTIINNAIKGEAGWGVMTFPFGTDIQIIGNDLSGLTTAYAQIELNKPDTMVANNVFGPCEPDSYAAVLLLSVNWHPPGGVMTDILTPDPFPLENCMITGNDYRRTGLSEASIVLASESDMHTWVDSGDKGFEVMNNLIKETGKFPVGTGGPEKHVYIMILSTPPFVHDNRIVGLPARGIQRPGIGRLSSRKRKISNLGMKKPPR